MTARAELAELIAHPTGAAGGLTMREVVQDGRTLANDIEDDRGASSVEVTGMLRLLADLLDEVAAIVRDAP